MRYRKLDANNDRQFGSGQDDFWINVPDGVAQACDTRLHLNLGEFFLDTTDGTAWATEVLGNRTAGTRDAVVRGRILQTEGVSQMDSYSSSFDHFSRAFVVTTEIDTIYGATTLAAVL